VVRRRRWAGAEPRSASAATFLSAFAGAANSRIGLVGACLRRRRARAGSALLLQARTPLALSRLHLSEAATRFAFVVTDHGRFFFLFQPAALAASPGGFLLAVGRHPLAYLLTLLLSDRDPPCSASGGRALPLTEGSAISVPCFSLLSGDAPGGFPGGGACLSASWHTPFPDDAVVSGPVASPGYERWILPVACDAQSAYWRLLGCAHSPFLVLAGGGLPLFGEGGPEVIAKPAAVASEFWAHNLLPLELNTRVNVLIELAGRRAAPGRPALFVPRC